MSDYDDDYEVGYGKPPEEYQFSRGQSGNPSGRPKNQKNVFEKDLDEVLSQKILVKKDGIKIEFTKIEVFIINLVNKALKGDLKSFKQLIRLLDKPVKSESRMVMQECMSDGTIKRMYTCGDRKIHIIKPRGTKKLEDGTIDVSSNYPRYDMNPKKFIDYILEEKIAVKDKNGSKEITKRLALLDMLFFKASAGNTVAFQILYNILPDSYFMEEHIIDVQNMDLLEGL